STANTSEMAEIANYENSAELMFERGVWSARVGQWKEASRDLLRCVELEPENPERYHFLAPLLIKANDIPAYKTLRSEILRRFGSTADPLVADRMTKACLLLTPSPQDLDRISSMADIAAA